MSTADIQAYLTAHRVVSPSVFDKPLDLAEESLLHFLVLHAIAS